MVSQREEGSGGADRSGGSERPDRTIGSDAPQGSREVDGSGPSGALDAGQASRGTSGGLTERLRDVLQDEGDEDLLLGCGDVDNGFLQWLRALDTQVIGACRADERLRPLPKLSISGGVAEDRLMAQLSQHFEASEVGMITRCLCIPLISIRVGMINKQRNLLCPTSTRGHLNLTLLPSSNMRLTFSSDDGCNERLAVVCHGSTVTIEELSSDTSGRSFLLRLPGSRVLYFWCSEKSNFHGMELLSKMKDLLKRKPSLSHLTGISDSRLDAFATHVRSYLLRSSDTTEAAKTAALSSMLRTASSLHESNPVSQSSSTLLKSSPVRLTAGHTAKANTFKEELARSLTSVRNSAREKLRRRGDSHSNKVTTSHLSLSESALSSTYVPSSNQFEDGKLSGGRKDSARVPSCLPDLLCLPPPVSAFISSSSHLPLSNVTDPNSILSPYYCWCPPFKSAMQSTVTLHLPSTLSDSLPLPPLSSLLSAVGSPVSLVPSDLPCDVTELPTLNLPTLLPDPLVHLPFPVSSLVTMPGSQQIPTFTPLMSDPIVHIPVIDVCSSGPAYLVSAGPAISSSVPPLLPKVGSPLIPETDSLVEKSARETLRMLMASAPVPTSPGLINVLPVVLGSIQNFSHASGDKGGGSLASQNLCGGSWGVDASANRLASAGLSCSKGRTSEACCAARSKVDSEAQDPEGSSCTDENLPLN